MDNLTIEAKYPLAIVNGVTVSPGAADMTVDGSVASLEIGSSTLGIRIGRLAMTSTGLENASGGLVTFEGG